MIFPVENVGTLGIIKDIPPYSLPDGAWSDGRNVRMKEGSVQKFLGHEEVFDPPSVAPFFLMSAQTSSTYFWIYAGLAKIFVTDGVAHTDLTNAGGDYGTTANEPWTGIVTGGIPILTNNVDPPQMWKPVQVSQKLTDLANWPAATLCKALRNYKTHLIAMNVTISGTENPRLVKWSHAAAFNDVPSSWDETDDTVDAGEYELADTRGDLIDGLQLQDAFILYKDDAIWGMQYIGAPLIFRFYRISTTIGMIAKRCVAEFEGQHFVFGIDDCIITDGVNIKTILNNRYRRAIYDNINSDHFLKCFVVNNLVKNEVWACFPSGTSVFPDQALVWNWRDDTLGIRDIPQTAFIAYGIVDDSAVDDTWDDGPPTTWDGGAVGVWNRKQYNPTIHRLLFAGTNDIKLYIGDETTQENGTNMISRIERTGLVFGDMKTIKYCSRVNLFMEATGAVDIYVGSQMQPEEGIKWEGPFMFDPRIQHKIDCRVTGRLLALKIESNSGIDWKLNKYEMNVKQAGFN